MNWKSLKDIDWALLERRIPAKLEKLFESPPNPQPQFDLVFCIDLNGGLNYDVYQKLPGDKQIRLGDIVEGWNREMDDLQELCGNLVSADEFDAETEADGDAFPRTEARLRDLIRPKCEELAKKNFGYQTDVPIRWKIIDDLRR